MRRTGAIVVAMAAALFVANAVYAGCGGCATAAAKTAVSAQADSTGGCPVAAAVSKMTLSDAQTEKVKAAQADFDAAMKKAGCVSCPKSSGKAKAAAAAAYLKAVNAALTPEQQKALAAALPATGCPLIK